MNKTLCDGKQDLRQIDASMASGVVRQWLERGDVVMTNSGGTAGWIISNGEVRSILFRGGFSAVWKGAGIWEDVSEWLNAHPDTKAKLVCGVFGSLYGTSVLGKGLIGCVCEYAKEVAKGYIKLGNALDALFDGSPDAFEKSQREARDAMKGVRHAFEKFPSIMLGAGAGKAVKDFFGGGVMGSAIGKAVSMGTSTSIHSATCAFWFRNFRFLLYFQRIHEIFDRRVSSDPAQPRFSVPHVPWDEPFDALDKLNAYTIIESESDCITPFALCNNSAIFPPRTITTMTINLMNERFLTA